VKTHTLFLPDNVKHSGDPGLDVRIILKCVLEICEKGYIPLEKIKTFLFLDELRNCHCLEKDSVRCVYWRVILSKLVYNKYN